jgi:competence protein ComGC
MRYAIGEIILVMIGILLALQVNNWNEERKKQNLKGVYKRALMEDLEKDINQLSIDIDKTVKDLENCKSIGRIITENELDVDSIIIIYRKEFDFFIYVDRNFNRNTIEALLGSGNINLFEDTLYDDLMRFNNLQKEVVSAIDTELGFYMNYLTQNNLPQTDEVSLIQGGNLEQIWNLIDKDKFLMSFNSVLNSKSIVNKEMLDKRRELMKETKSLLELLSDID